MCVHAPTSGSDVSSQRKQIIEAEKENANKKHNHQFCATYDISGFCLFFGLFVFFLNFKLSGKIYLEKKSISENLFNYITIDF